METDSPCMCRLQCCPCNQHRSLSQVQTAYLQHFPAVWRRMLEPVGALPLDRGHQAAVCPPVARILHTRPPSWDIQWAIKKCIQSHPLTRWSILVWKKWRLSHGIHLSFELSSLTYGVASHTVWNVVFILWKTHSLYSVWEGHFWRDSEDRQVFTLRLPHVSFKSKKQIWECVQVFYHAHLTNAMSLFVIVSL